MFYPVINLVLFRSVALNGQALAMVNSVTLPELPPKEEPPADIISLPALSFGFMVFKDAAASACIKT